MESILNIIIGKHASINMKAMASCLYQIHVYKVTHWIQAATGMVVVTVMVVEWEMMMEVEVMMVMVLTVVALRVMK